MKTKLDPQVFRDAAERIADYRDTFCCDALTRTQGIANYSKETRHHLFFGLNFKPEYQTLRNGWWERHEREARILALLLSAEMCKR